MKLVKLKNFGFVVVALLCLGYFLSVLERPDSDFFQVETCPACYGINCKDVLNKELRLKHLTKLKYYNALLNVKNVYYGQIDTYDCVLKKLAHTYELVELDQRLCQAAGLAPNCPVDLALENVLEKHGYDPIRVVEGEKRLFEASEPLKCRHRAPLRLLYESFSGARLSQHTIHHFVTLLAVNAEPILIQSFGNVIPLPKFYGACGRVAVEEYVGKTLSEYTKAPWETRAAFALQLLEIARKMTFNAVRMYLTDPSADNFAVDGSSGAVKLIDVENIVLVDSAQPGLNNEVHHNDGFGCRDCLSFDYADLCNHNLSDHNFFAICKGLLSADSFSSSFPRGLLHSIPGRVLAERPDLPGLIENCALPNASSFENRLEPAVKLSRALQELLRGTQGFTEKWSSGTS